MSLHLQIGTNCGWREPRDSQRRPVGGRLSAPDGHRAGPTAVLYPQRANITSRGRAPARGFGQLVAWSGGRLVCRQVLEAPPAPDVSR